MLTMTAVAAAGATTLAFMPISGPGAVLPVIVMLAIVGGAINGAQVALYALAAHVYPTEFRTTGMGAAIGFGRIGAVFTGYVGSWAIDAGVAWRSSLSIPGKFGKAAARLVASWFARMAPKIGVPIDPPIERKRLALEHRRKAVEAQVAVLRSEFHAEEEEFARTAAEAQTRAEALAVTREALARSRKVSTGKSGGPR